MTRTKIIEKLANIQYVLSDLNSGSLPTDTDTYKTIRQYADEIKDLSDIMALLIGDLENEN